MVCEEGECVGVVCEEVMCDDSFLQVMTNSQFGPDHALLLTEVGHTHFYRC